MQDGYWFQCNMTQRRLPSGCPTSSSRWSSSRAVSFLPLPWDSQKKVWSLQKWATTILFVEWRFRGIYEKRGSFIFPSVADLCTLGLKKMCLRILNFNFVPWLGLSGHTNFQLGLPIWIDLANPINLDLVLHVGKQDIVAVAQLCNVLGSHVLPLALLSKWWH